MKKYMIILFLSIAYFVQGQDSPFPGTWKWENGNQTFYVYIKSETLNTGNKVLSLDYRMTETDNSMETEIYSSKFDGQFFFGGAILAEKPTTASGNIDDRTHPYNGIDAYMGNIGLEVLQTNPPTLWWKLYKLRDNIQGRITSNSLTEFNLPTDIILTKVSSDILYD